MHRKTGQRLLPVAQMVAEMDMLADLNLAAWKKRFQEKEVKQQRKKTKNRGVVFAPQMPEQSVEVPRTVRGSAAFFVYCAADGKAVGGSAEFVPLHS